MYKYPSYMYHHGVKGMKWGVRHYQNADGSLTPAGKKRRERDRLENRGAPDSNRWVKEDLTRAKKTVDATSNLARNLNDLNRSTSKKRTNTIDLSNMSNKELQNAITRANLERQYNDLYNQSSMSKGRKTVDNILNYGGTALAIGSSALGIALAIKELKG